MLVLAKSDLCSEFGMGRTLEMIDVSAVCANFCQMLDGDLAWQAQIVEFRG